MTTECNVKRCRKPMSNSALSTKVKEDKNNSKRIKRFDKILFLHGCRTRRARVMVFNACCQQHFSFMTAVSWWKPTTDLSQVTDKLYHIMLYREHLAWVRFELTTFDNQKGNYDLVYYWCMLIWEVKCALSVIDVSL